MTRDLVFQKRLNDLLLQQVWELKPAIDKLNNEILKLYLCYKTLACTEQQRIL